MKHTLAIIMCLLMLACAVWAQDSQDNQPVQNTQNSEDTVTIKKSDLDALKERLDKLEQDLQEIKNGQAPAQSSEPASAASTEETSESSSGGKSLALPDFSLVGQAKGLATNDTRNENRNQIRLSEVELGIQGYVYPNLKADAFLSASPQEDEPFQVEETYLTYLGALKGLNISVGKKYVPFGRTNLLHSHSWPYVNQPLAIRNLVAEENLTGEGMQASYLLPTPGNLFAQLDLGTWTSSEAGESKSIPDDIERGPGAGFNGNFNTGRLWTGYPVSENSELELGGSYAEGDATDLAIPVNDRVRLTGADLTYRHYTGVDSRLLLRAENFWRRELDQKNTATGYYVFGNYRWNRYGSLGLLYDWSEFPQAPNLHETALSLIYTHQFSEQYYIRLQATRGAKPDCDPCNEYWIQWVWGIGPHTHNLE